MELEVKVLVCLIHHLPLLDYEHPIPFSHTSGMKRRTFADDELLVEVSTMLDCSLCRGWYVGGALILSVNLLFVNQQRDLLL